MSKLIAHIFACLCSVYLGLSFLFDPSPTFGGFSVPNQLGIFFLVFGILYLLYGIFFRKKIMAEKKAEKALEIVLMCPNCREPAFAKDFPDMKCKKCDAEVEKVEGFYDRHPEKRNDEKKLK